MSTTYERAQIHHSKKKHILPDATVQHNTYAVYHLCTLFNKGRGSWVA